MKSLSSVGLALSVVFGCLLLALIAELYYLLWWKNRILKTNLEDGYSNSSKAREFCFMFCGKPSTTSLTPSNALKSQEICSSDTQLVHEPTQLQLGSNVDSSSDFWFKPFGDDTMDDEFMGLCGPPRFLFTIKEETKEDLESEDGKSKSRKGSRTRSLSDLCLNVETPFLTPLASPSCFTPPLSPIVMSKNGFSFNPFLESASDAEFNKFIRSNSSPPPTFQFLRDAEDKFCRRFDQNLEVSSSSKMSKDHEENSGPFITLIFPKNREVQLDQHHVQHSSSSSQVLPLASSPPIQQVNQQE
ncbi:uncharacterized protein LOC107018823 [Solanum pennellii]|uniref:Uncharacterized protein LOC107018823 n=1 Tax=Solanum pennellii TaxID=28526 RepID=A0ABM1GRM0_SOLPN|nr:uncharacterized protein LOC107018823 [Solanum pennellii]